MMSPRPLPRGSLDTPGLPGLQFDRRPGQVRGSCGAQRTSGCGPAAGPTPARLAQRIPRRWACPTGNGVLVAFTVPVRKRVKHVWTCWGAVSGQLRPAPAAQHRREAETPNQSGSGCCAGGGSRGGLSVDSLSVPGRGSRAEPPRTTGPLTAGRNRGAVFLPECPQRSLAGDVRFPPLLEKVLYRGGSRG